MNIPSFSESRKKRSNDKKTNAPAELTFGQIKPSSASTLFTGKMGILIVLGFASLAGIFAMQFNVRKGLSSYVHDIENANVGSAPAVPPNTFPSEPQVAVQLAGNEEAPKPSQAVEPTDAVKIPEIEERKMLTAKEARDHLFREPKPEFVPLDTLDPNSEDFQMVYERVFDEDVQTQSGYQQASNLGYANEAIYLFFRYLRTINGDSEKLKAYEKQRIEELTPSLGEKGAIANRQNVMDKPIPHRGQPYFFQGNLLKKFQVQYWGGDELNKSGIQDTWMLIGRDRFHQTYAVLVPHDVKHLISRDDADMSDNFQWRGLFLQRWAFVRTDNMWDAMPVYVATLAQKIPRPEVGTTKIMLAICGVGLLGLLWILRILRRDAILSENMRKLLMNKRAERRKQQKKEPTANNENVVAAESSPDPAT